MVDSNLKKTWLSLPPSASEDDIYTQLMRSVVLPVLGFSQDEICGQYMTGQGNNRVDIAARKNTIDDNFSHTKTGAELIVELKARDSNLSGETTSYKNAVKQLKKYLTPDATHCQKVKWGLITNADRIQLFRRHGRVVYPYTTNIELNASNIDEKIALIEKYTQTPTRALTVTLYNNKGGVGKTTTAINIAGILGLPKSSAPSSPGGFGKKVLLVDFDPNQRDLTEFLDIKPGRLTLLDYLRDRKNRDLKEVISTYIVPRKRGKDFNWFDVIPADQKFIKLAQSLLIPEVGGKNFLRKALNSLKNDYDYIIIDAQPGWTNLNQEAINAADVILMPSKQNNWASFKNAAKTISKFIPDVGDSRRKIYPDLADPTALPLFFNGEQISPAQKKQAQDAILEIVNQARQEDRTSLESFFFPKCTPRNKDYSIFEVPNSAHIASAAFSGSPAVLRREVVRSYYRELVREYLI